VSQLRIKHLAATPDEAALVQPFIGSALPPMPGLPLGINTRLNSPNMFDPWWAHRLGIVNSPVYLITGNKSSGKSTLQKVLALRYGARRGASTIHDGQMRIRFYDRKLESAEPEYSAVVSYLGGKIVNLSRQASINIFDPLMNMSETDIVETATNTCEMISNISPLPRFQNLAIQAGVWKMLREGGDVNPEVLESKLYGLTTADVKDYYTEVNPGVVDLNLPRDQFEEDASIVAACFGSLVRGSYGGIFGGKNSLRDVLSENVLLLDWMGVPDRARTLLSAMLWKWDEISQRNGDHEIIPDMIFSDEESTALNNIMYARFMSASLKEARAKRTAYFMSTQHETDLTMAGDPGSEIRKLCESIGLGISGRFIFEQPHDKQVLEIYRQMNFSSYDVGALPGLKRGSFFFHAQGQAPIPVHLVLTPIEERLSQTEGAVISMTNTNGRVSD